jgi:four helix bundle protein
LRGEELGKRNQDMKSFRNLNVYINAKELVRRVYELLKKFPKEEQYALCDQLRRAVVSIPSNIAEGCGRETQKDQTHFLNIAYGSLMEVLAQMDVACDLGYVQQEEFDEIERFVDEEAKMIRGMIRKRKDAAL